MWIQAAALVMVIASAATSAANLTVRYYNQAGVPAKLLESAVESASIAMRTAGIQVRWLNCHATPEVCQDAGDRALELNLTTAPAAEARRPGVNAGFSMGYSLLPENGAGGVYAKVLWNRVIAYAKTVDVPVATVLGHVMAHELGHLLLNTAQHSRHGIMKGVWTGSDRALLTGGRLVFHGREAAAMRRRLAGGLR
jgi:hypothetical protein